MNYYATTSRNIARCFFCQSVKNSAKNTVILNVTVINNLTLAFKHSKLSNIHLFLAKLTTKILILRITLSVDNNYC
jgi:hypothetical protein